MSQKNLASLWRRVGAALIDLIVIVVAVAIALFVWGVIEGLQQVSTDKLTWETRGFLMGLGIDLVYSVVLMAGAKQSTYGQRALGIRVRKLNGADVELGSALGRYLVSLVSSVIFKLGFFIAVFTKHNQTLHDLAAGTIVVYELAPQPRGYAKTPTSTSGTESSDFTSAPKGVASANPTLYKAVPAQSYASASTSATTELPEMATLSDEALYEQALTELSTNKKPSLWAMALAQTAKGGNPDGAYIALRVDQLRGERIVETPSTLPSLPVVPSQSPNSELAVVAHDSRVRLMQQAFYDVVETVQRSKEHSIDFDKHYRALVNTKYAGHAKTLVWLCEYEILEPGGVQSAPNSYVVRRSPSDEPIAVLKGEKAFVEWAVAAFAVRPNAPVEYL